MSKAVILLNLGTPAEPTTKGVRAFHRRFFSDPFVFDMPAWGRWMLRNLIILPFRSPKIAEQYQKIWLDTGSPLKVYTDALRDSLEKDLNENGNKTEVLIGMAYSEPSIKKSMMELEKKGITEIIALPLFPQYSTATTASVSYEVNQSVLSWKNRPTVTIIDDFFNHPSFVSAWAKIIKNHLEKINQKVDHVVFSYHGLPEKNIKKADSHNHCQFGSCCDTITEKNQKCYRAQCMGTTRGIVENLGWESDYYSVAFQSRFGKDPWIEPYLDEHLKILAAKGYKNVAVACPSFVSDCLETIHEIGIEYKEEFLDSGGESLVLIPNLNDNKVWFDAVRDIILATSGWAREEKRRA